jgi:subtilisin family serine protease
MKLVRPFMRAPCRIYALIIAILAVISAPAAWGGRINSGLMQSLKTAAPTDHYAVIVKMTDKVDLNHLKESLGKEEKKRRQMLVVHALRDKAKASLSSITSDLDAKEREGRIRKVKVLWAINGFAFNGDAEAIRELAARNDVEEVIPDRIVALALPVPALAAGSGRWNLDMIGAPVLWQLGYSGQGTVVANLDSGVDVNHAALSAKWRGGVNSWFDAFDAVDPFHPTTTPFDDNGHGTSTMGVMVAGNTTDNPVGVAPNSTWIAARIFDSKGNGSISGIHEAFQWLLDPDNDPNTADAPDVVNCSWTLDQANPGTYDGTFAVDIQALNASGIAVVFAAGNSGPFPGTSVSPANNPGAFPVGATGSDDLVTTTSSRGPSAYDNSIYPVITAPGSGIRTTALTGGGNFPDSYTTVDGTSVAAPHVAGALALLLSINPNLSVSELENTVRSSALDLGSVGPDNSYGSGRLDAVRAAEDLNLLPPVSPDGDVDGDGAVTARDALIVLRAAVGLTPWSAFLMYHGDVAPLVSGVPAPDRHITIADALLVLRKAVGAVSY